ncbi:pentachlorophenol monooxygenase/3-(3-hydroxy-phenyl)propionate hydroxylase [Prauserella marina]|uniref:Pentachlorophenol monooxygenase/3-(3-hydroxy-phenyl)propionate hydroxylase n=1 Tax=Prauserella marina TaxID=530584 RepID=A0A1G6VVN3_9PSEU|nr:FAD-dependent monooxygenase [Prauserella marina]PWV73864.1 pentachlorophenol monooxygenase/3-(3-hydroxy-phenyl)propionate hydroxylase [Prauserella marina]SDD57740.1 pentachlorophenol monooxygenase/3-(3-hydroxy-phenyl)propionate hydroxylase [Prauserella marina]
MSPVQPPAAEPVAVVGNGPVGQTAALLLARWGVPVLLLDRRAERDHVGSKAICQQRDVLDIWESVGAGLRIAREGLTWTTARTFYRDTELFAYPVAEGGRSCFPPFVNLSQTRTEEILDERIAVQPLIDVRWGHTVTGLTRDADGVELRFAHGEALRASHAVLCAGARGEPLREALGVTFDGHSFDDRFLICDIRTDLPGWADERRFYFDPLWNPGRQVLIHPCPGSTFRIDWQVPRDYDLAAEEADGSLDRRIRAIIGDRDYDIVWKSVYRFQSRIANRFRSGRVLLAGDCAHLVAPFGARGLNSGVADAENLAWKLAFVLRGWAGEGLLESYHAERHAAAVENLEVTGATMRFLVPGTEAEFARREQVLNRAAGDPSAYSDVDSGKLSEPFWYKDSPLTTPDSTRPPPRRPRRGEVPACAPGTIVADAPLTADGEDTRLRALARDGFLLLCTRGVATRAVEDAAGEAASGSPVRVMELAADAAGALGARPGEVWVIRPDAHVAAIVTTPAAAAAAVRTALGGGLSAEAAARSPSAAAASGRTPAAGPAAPTPRPVPGEAP